MPQQENLSNQNAFVRLACGAGMTAFGIAKLSRKPDCMRGKAMIILGAMKMAEGVLKFCPTKAIMNSSITSIINELQTNNSNSSKAGSGLGAAASAAMGAMGGFSSSSNTGSNAPGTASGTGTNPISDVAQLMKDFASTSTTGAQQNKQNNQSSTSNQQTSSTQPFNLNQQTNKQQTNKQQSNTTQPSKS